MAVAPVQTSFDLVPPHLAVQSMRDNGYKNTAYAIAELIDNSIQAGAKSVELLCSEVDDVIEQRRRRRAKQIAVLDNGCGMDALVLRQALQFGNGTHLNDRSGMGRFGMGLPSASISQCRRVDVWTWKQGVDKALHTYIDLGEVQRGESREVPEPEIAKVPKMWRDIGKSFGGESGTLVVWSDADRLMWRSGKAIIDNSEFLIGRIYRRFINSGEAAIRLAAFLESTHEFSIDRYAEANDPLYLMAPTSAPAPYDQQAMFKPYGEPHDMKVKFEGTEHVVRITMSYASEEARKTSDSGVEAGSQPHGKHAAKNIGVSLMRARRELDLVTNGFVIGYDPVERWWGVEVDFPPALDEIFGVTNNKQSARNFTEMAATGLDALLEEGETEVQLRERLRQENDPRVPLIDIREYINNNLRQIRRSLTDQRRRTRGGVKKRWEADSAEVKATTKTRERQEEGHVGASDVDENRPAEEREAELEQALEAQGVPSDEAHELAAETVSKGLKYIFGLGALETPAFFSVESKAGVLNITLNTSHPAYEQLIEVLEDDYDEASPDALRERLQGAANGLKLLLSAWARYEDEATPQTRDRVTKARWDWGTMAREFLTEPS